MSIKFFGILTHQGAARLANAAALGTKLDLSTMAVGDGGGSLPFPDPTQTALKGERRRAALNQLSIDPLNGNQIIAEQVIPENEGGWWIREIGLFDKDGPLIAVANCPESYKPQMQEGSGRTQTIRMVLIVNSTKELALKIDPSIVLATRKYVDDGVIEVKAYADTLMATHAHHADPHPQYAPKASPVFTGTPKAPTAKTNNNSTQLATTAFVQTAQNACLRKDDNLAALKDKAKSRANLDVYSRTEADNHYLPKTGGIVNGSIEVTQSIHIGGNDSGLRADGDGKVAFYAKNARVAAWNKDHLHWLKNVRIDGTLEAKAATFRGNIAVSWGGRTARYLENGDIEGQIWGSGSLSSWLNNQLNSRSRTQVSGGRGGWWYKDELSGFVFQGGVVSRSGNNTRVTFPVGYQRECFGVQMTLSAWRQSSGSNIFAAGIENSGFTAVMYAQEVEANWWAVGV